jgi:hypothetical protein
MPTACPRCGLVHPPGVAACPDGLTRPAPPRPCGARLAALGVLAVAVIGGGVGFWVRTRDDARARAEGVLGVSSEPAGARVSVMGADQPGATPLLVPHLPRGRRLEVRLTKEGYRPWTGSALIPVERGDERLRITLEPVK